MIEADPGSEIPRRVIQKGTIRTVNRGEYLAIVVKIAGLRHSGAACLSFFTSFAAPAYS